jgi:hypothetical protein
MEEEWKDIANFEGLYQVSNLGRVKSLPKVGSGGHNGIILSQSKDKDGYLKETLIEPIQKEFLFYSLIWVIMLSGNGVQQEKLNLLLDLIIQT